MFKPSKTVYAETNNYTITANAQYVNKYTPAKRIYGYVKDSNGYYSVWGYYSGYYIAFLDSDCNVKATTCINYELNY